MKQAGVVECLEAGDAVLEKDEAGAELERALPDEHLRQGAAPAPIRRRWRRLDRRPP